MVSYESGWRTNDKRVKAQVIDLRENGFGKEVKLEYDRFEEGLRIRDRTEWIPAESHEIGDFSLYEPSPEIAMDSKYEKRRRGRKTAKRKKGNRRESGHKRSERKMRKYGRIPKYAV